jgi:two-component system NarL family response regulator
MRVIIVDGHTLFREGLISLLEQEEGIRVVDQAGSISEALEKISALQPHVLLLDLALLDGKGLEIIPTLQLRSPHTKIVVLTSSKDEQLPLKALEYGARGYLTKNISHTELIDCLKSLGSFQEERVNIARLPVKTSPPIFSDNGQNYSDLQFLTRREREVLDLLGTGTTNQEIAERLGISQATVRFYVSKIMLKLHLGDRWNTNQFAPSGLNHPNENR